MSGEGTKDMATTFQPDWENCPDCGAYFQGSHLCDKSREAVLLRVEQKLDRILACLEGLASPIQYVTTEGAGVDTETVLTPEASDRLRVRLTPGPRPTSSKETT